MKVKATWKSAQDEWTEIHTVEDPSDLELIEHSYQGVDTRIELISWEEVA